MKFILVRPTGIKSNLVFGHYRSAYPPLDLQYVAASLEEKGYIVEIIDFAYEDLSKKHLKDSLASSDAVGINVYSGDLESAVYISNIIKELDQDIPLIIGGPHCIFMQGKSLEDFSCANISVVGEGERTIVDIAKFLQGTKKLSDIPGIFYRDGENIRRGKNVEVIKDLDYLPFPARHLTEKYDYIKNQEVFFFKPKLTAMSTSRGCPFNCRFCSGYKDVIKGFNYRQRSAENVVKEILEIDKKYNSVLIVDDNFLHDKKRAHMIMDELIEHKTKIHLYVQGTRVTSAEETLYKKMKRANVKFILYGIESGNQDVLDYYNKKITLDQIKKAVRLSSKMGFITAGNFILGSSIETDDHIKKTMKFACSLPLDLAFFKPLHYQLKSPLWLEAVKNKKIYEEERVVMADSDRGLGNFTKNELSNFILKSYKKFYFRPSYLLSQIYKSFLRKDFGLLKKGLKAIISFQK